jgi:iron complex outermembrane receptor protein
VEVFSLLIDTDHRDLAAMARYSQTIGDHELMVGLNVGDGRVTGAHHRNLGGRPNGRTERIDNDARTWELFALDRWSINESFTLEFAIQGVRAERATRTTDIATVTAVTPSGDYDAVNPRIGLTWQVGADATLFANLSRLYEPPTNFELADDARASNEPLDAMNGTVLEVGSHGSGPFANANRWYWDAAIYWAEIRDEILSVDDPAAPGTSLSTNIDKTVHAGIELLLGAEIALGERLRLDPKVGATFNWFEFDGDRVYADNTLPAAPDYAVRGELMLRIGDGFYIGPTFDLIGDRWADFANTYRVDDYQLVGLRTGYEAARFSVFVEAQNLSGADWVATHGVRDLAAADAALLNPGAPRSVYAGFSVVF